MERMERMERMEHDRCTVRRARRLLGLWRRERHTAGAHRPNRDHEH